MAISRMQQSRQMYNQGGYADMGLMAPRQNYGLGSFVKKAVRGVKKIVKSPIGKAAIIGLGGAGLMGMGPLGGMLGGTGASIGRGLGALRSGVGGMFTGAGKGLGKGGMFSSVGNLFKVGGKEDGALSIPRMLMGGLGATALAAPFLAGKDDEPEEVGEVMDVANVRNRAQNFYSGMGDKGVGLNFMPKKKYVDQNFYAADGGRANFAMGGDTDDEDDEIAFARSGAGQRYRPAQTFLNMGGDAGNAQAEQMLMAEFVKYKNKGGDLSFEQFVQAVMQQQEQAQGMEQPTMMAADGGRMGYEEAGPVIDQETIDMVIQMNSQGHDMSTISTITEQPIDVITNIINSLTQQADGGLTSVPGYGTPAGTNQFGYPSGGVRVNAAEGGIMDTEEASEMIDMGGQEKDYRDEGGFVAMGGEERADDVPARLSKNEFVFTADAVRNAGGGDIDRGSEVMQNLMDNLEQGGQVSEDSQGLGGEEMMMSEEMIEEPNGAQAMYEQQQALQSRIA
jgi:hypothetical protein